MTRKSARARVAAQRRQAAGNARAETPMTAVGLAGPRGAKPTGRARAIAHLTEGDAPCLRVCISSEHTNSSCKLPIGEVLARVHIADLLDELQRRMRTPTFPVFCDWLMSRGDALGAALAIFTEHLAALRRKSTPPTTGEGSPSGSDHAGVIEASPFAAMERPSNRLPF
jgi:hypothetical protein